LKDINSFKSPRDIKKYEKVMEYTNHIDIENFSKESSILKMLLQIY